MKWLGACFIIVFVLLACRPSRADEVRYIKVDAKGYCGPIKMIVSLNSDRTIKSVRIIEQNETAGIGTRITEPGFLKQFEGKTAREVVERKGVDAITGATISSDAVIEAVGREVSEFLSRHPSQLRK